MNHLWFGKSLKEAIAAPVVFVDPANGVKFEDDFDKVCYIMCVHLLKSKRLHLSILFFPAPSL